MARVYSPVADHNRDLGVDFFFGAAVVPDADTARRAWFTAHGYTVVAGKDALTVWDKLPMETLQAIAPLFGIDPAGKAKDVLSPAFDTNLATKLKIEITAFDAIGNVAGGSVASHTYADAAAVIAALPATVIATIGGGTAVVPVTTWVDTDTYNGGAAASYTFTATLGAIPVPYLNTAGVTITVEVVITA